MKLLSNMLLISLLLVGNIVASGNPKVKKEIKENTVKSLMNGLNSDNLGLRNSCAYMLGELELKAAIIPLMKILREEENEDIRITAALALYKIGTPMSINAVKQSIRFDNSERVSKHCASFYYNDLKNKSVAEEINEDVDKLARN